MHVLSRLLLLSNVRREGDVRLTRLCFLSGRVSICAFLCSDNLVLIFIAVMVYVNEFV
jgi:hypothetical protein